MFVFLEAPTDFCSVASKIQLLVQSSMIVALLLLLVEFLIGLLLCNWFGFSSFASNLCFWGG
jgi:hypothetical protein